MEKHKFASISLTVQDRAISSKFSTHRVSEECTLGNFQKIFPSPKMAAILNFRIFAKKMAKHKFASISLTVRDRAISSNFSIHRGSYKCTLGNFQKIFISPKMAAILNFRILPKMEKHKFPPISLTMQDRAISSRFSTPRVSEQCTLGNVQNIFLFPHMAAILNFQIFAKNGKTQICFYLLNRAR